MHIGVYAGANSASTVTSLIGTMSAGRTRADITSAAGIAADCYLSWRLAAHCAPSAAPRPCCFAECRATRERVREPDDLDRLAQVRQVLSTHTGWPERQKMLRRIMT